MNENLIITDLGGGYKKVVAAPGYKLYNKTTQRYYSSAEVKDITPYTAIADTPPEPHERTLQEAKDEKIAALRAYDASSAVNAFSLDSQEMWIAPDERANYILTLQGAKRLGVETVTFLGQAIPVDNALAMLDAVNLYAMQCVGVTQAHEAAINALATIEAVDGYDYTVGYPEKLSF